MMRVETSKGDDRNNDNGDGATRTRARTGLDDSVFTPSYNRDIYMLYTTQRMEASAKQQREKT